MFPSVAVAMVLCSALVTCVLLELSVRVARSTVLFTVYTVLLALRSVQRFHIFGFPLPRSDPDRDFMRQVERLSRARKAVN